MTIGFDVTFPESDRTAPGWLFDALDSGMTAQFDPEMMSGPSNDTIFADAMRRSRVVLGMSGTNRMGALGDKPAETPLVKIGGDPAPFIPSSRGIVTNLAELDEAAAGRGAFSLLRETDGILRRVPTLLNVNMFCQNSPPKSSRTASPLLERRQRGSTTWCRLPWVPGLPGLRSTGKSLARSSAAIFSRGPAMRMRRK
ncbi:MAG: hypothetical protein J0626_11300 [Rhodospirillaceae bacterium]|nr:hypothetical protein [Rhodospirillaceae bacterium]